MTASPADLNGPLDRRPVKNGGITPSDECGATHDLFEAPQDRRLALTRKIFQRSIWPTVAQISSGGPSRAPLIVDLDPTSYCDLACPECISGTLLNQERFTREALIRVCDEIADAGVKGVVLIGGGEPLAHPATGEAITLLGKRDVRLGLVTNGTLIHRHMDSISNYVDWVRVSVDAGTAETYNYFRPSRRGQNVFGQVIANMRALSLRRKASLGFSYLVMSRPATASSPARNNVDELVTAAQLAEEIGCDYMEVKAMLDPGHFVQEQGEDFKAKFREQVSRAQKVQTDEFRVILNSSTRALLQGESPVQEKSYGSCYVAELRTLVTSDGVYVCPYHRGDGRFKLGDVSVGFSDMWAEADRGIVSPAVDCRFHCARHETNVQIGDVAATGQHFEVVDDYDLFL